MKESYLKKKIKKDEWYVADTPLKEGQKMVAEHHYAKGGSNTCVYMHGIYRKHDSKLHGVAWWLPPTKVACKSVNDQDWKKVLSLTRMVMLPGTPKNACSFLLSRSIKMIAKEGRFVSLVTYADEAENHTGNVYRASNWTYVGRTGPYPKWIDPKSGRQVAQKSTKNRRKSEMEALGHIKKGSYYKHKYVMHIGNNHMKESYLKKKINKDLDAEGMWHYAPVQMGRGASGIPDIIACKPVKITLDDVGKTMGLFVGVEAKIHPNKPTKLQMVQLKGIAEAGGMALVITGKPKEQYKVKRVVG